MRWTLILWASFLACRLAAVQTHAFTQQSFGDFQEGTPRNVALDNQGRLQVAPALRPWATLPVSSVWEVAVGPGGTAYVATGPDAKVLRVDSEGQVEEVFRGPDPLVTALAVAEDGTVFAATGPDGAVYRLPPGRPAELFVDPGVTYVWELALADGALWLATGGPARLLRLPLDDAAAAPEVWLEALGENVTVARRDGRGTWWLGTGSDGLVYRVTGPGQATVAFKAEAPEISDIVCLPDGRTFFATFAPKAPEGEATPSLVVRATPSADIETTPGPTGPAVLHELAPDGTVQTVFQTRQTALSVLMPLRSRGLLLGTNDHGKLYLWENRDAWTLAQAPEKGGSIAGARMLPNGEWLIATSQPAALYRLGGVGSDSVYTSKELDAQQPAYWASLEVTTDGRLDVTAEVRTGNTPKADERWSPWRPVTLEGDHGLLSGQVSSPAGRYLQYRLRLNASTPEAAGTVHRVRAFLQLPNLPPVISNLEVLPFAGEFVRMSSNPPGLDFDKAFDARAVEQFLTPGDGSRQIRRLDGISGVSLAWRAQDPNGDQLRYTVALSPAESEAWVVLASDLTDPFLTVPTTGLTEGLYRFALTASDAFANTPGLETRRVSEVTTVDHSPPVITLVRAERVDGRWSLVWRATDAWSVIARAQVRVNGGDPLDVRPTDKVFDSRDEELTVLLPASAPEVVDIVLEVADERDQLAVYARGFAP